MPALRKYPDELRQRAVRMVFEVRERTGGAPGAIARVADQLGVNRETLRNWVRQAEVDSGQRPGVTTVEQQRIAELEPEVRELRRANEILKAASAFLAAELDRPRTRRPGRSMPTGSASGSSRSAGCWSSRPAPTAPTPSASLQPGPGVTPRSTPR